MDFGEALKILNTGDGSEGGRVTREGWNGKGMWVAKQMPDGSTMDRPYLYISSVDGELVPWVPTQTDLLACDWVAV